MKIGKVALIGRPNTGKSTLINNLVGQKVAITSPKPQTTQFSTYAVYEDENAQIIFIDTPGIFANTKKITNRSINDIATKVLGEDIDVVLYIIDPTRKRGTEENKVLGILRKVETPKILVINKIDKLPEYVSGILRSSASPVGLKPSGYTNNKADTSYIEEYRFMEDEFDEVVEVSAIKNKNISTLVQTILKYLKEGEKTVVREDMPTPAINLNSNLYIEENIREKAFLVLRDELPYAIRVVVDEVIRRRKSKIYYIRARIITINKTYQKMIIGSGGSRIKIIGSMSRKELEMATGQKIYLDLTVEVGE